MLLQAHEQPALCSKVDSLREEQHATVLIESSVHVAHSFHVLKRAPDASIPDPRTGHGYRRSHAFCSAKGGVDMIVLDRKCSALCAELLRQDYTKAQRPRLTCTLGVLRMNTNPQ